MTETKKKTVAKKTDSNQEKLDAQMAEIKKMREKVKKRRKELILTLQKLL